MIGLACVGWLISRYPAAFQLGYIQTVWEPFFGESTVTWRHSIATQLPDAGAPMHKVSRFLGHSDPKITVKAYYSESEGLKVEDFIDVE